MTTPETLAPERPRGGFPWLKLLVSVLLMLLLATLIDFRGLADQVGRTDLVWFSLAFVLTLLRVLVSALRWQLLLRSKGYHISGFTLFRAYMVSSFYNLFFPSVLGGDVVRAYLVSSPLGSRSEAASSVILERLLGFLSLALIALAALLVGYNMVGPKVRLFVVLLFVGLLGGILLLFFRRLIGLFFRGISLLGLSRIRGALERFYNTFYAYKEKPGALLTTLGLSLLYQWLGIVVVALLGRSLGLSLSFTYYLVFLPLIWVIMMLPISISGLGLREGAFVFFFSKVGLSRETALLLSLLFFSHMVLMGLFGALMSLLPGEKPEKQE